MIDPTDIIKAYIREHQDMPSGRMARYLFARYPGLWPSEDACRTRIRYYRGRQGRGGKGRVVSKKELVKQLPKPKRKRKPKVALRDRGRWFVMGDLHVPFHDLKAVEAAVNFAIDKQCDHLILNGDILDAYQQSAWVKDPNQRSIDAEIAMASNLIKAIEGEFKGRKIFKIGNHEARIENYLFQNAPKMIGMSKWDLCSVLKSELGLGDEWSFIASKQLYTLGKLNGYHGHELPKGLTNPVSVGRGLWLRTKQSGFTNHWHSVSTHVETNGAKTKTWTCFSVGCLCDLHPDYAPINGWNHGCAYIDIDKNGNYSESNHRIVDGEIW